MDSISPDSSHGRMRPARPRLPTVDQAFQYTPLTSIVPFDPEIIPFPSAAPSSSPHVPLNRQDADFSARVLRRLNSEATNLPQASKYCKDTFRDVQQLLQGNDLTAYKFKSTQSPHYPVAKSSSDGNKHLTKGSEPHQYRSRNGAIGAFAWAILKHTDVEHCLAKLASPKPEQKSQKSSKPQDSPKIDPCIANGQTLDKPSHPSSPATPKGVPLSQDSKNELQVVVPKTPASNRSEYRSYPELDAAIIRGDDEPSRKRKRDEASPNKHLQAIKVDRNEQAHAALQNLHLILQSIFDAETNLEFDANAQSVFTTLEVDEGIQSVIAPDFQMKLDSAITKAISTGVFHAIPAESLVRLQKVCHHIIMLSISTEMVMPDDLDGTAIQHWLQRLELSDHGLRASRIALKLATAGRHEKQLYSEEVLRDLLTNLRQVLDSCVVPVVESRASSSCHEVLRGHSAAIARLGTIMQRLCRILKLIGDLVLKVDLSESSTNTIEAMVANLVFVENATTEKDAILGLQKFEALRRQAMDSLGRIFLQYPTQRRPILHEVLTSLEKLPVNRQSARQFKIIEGKPIQLVSALIMQLIQTSATRTRSRKRRRVDDPAESINAMADSASESSSSPELSPSGGKRRLDGDAQRGNSVVQGLRSAAQPLHDTAQTNASFVVNYLVQRALTSTKTGDQPYRNLLDIFTEDFIGVLGSSDWPAAEMLLTTLLTNLLSIMQGEKYAAPAKTMAVELMGIMASGIADLRKFIDRSCKNLEVAENVPAANLAQLCEEVLDGRSTDSEVLGVRGPYRAVVEYLQYRGTEDLQLQSARDFFLVQWSRNTWNSGELRSRDEQGTVTTNFSELIEYLHIAFEDPASSENDNEFGIISTNHGRLSYALVAATMPFCKNNWRIFSNLLSSLTSPHASVRNRALKSVNQLMDKDPSVLDRVGNTMGHIIKALADPSTLVKDSALVLIGKCFALKPALERDYLKFVVLKSSDAAVGVRKRALKLLKEIYLRNVQDDVRFAIADAFLRSLSDEEASVGEISRQSLEEVWITPYCGFVAATENSAQTKQALQHQAIQIALTTQNEDRPLSSLEQFFKELMSPKSRNAAVNSAVSKQFVNVLFDQIIENNQASNRTTRRAIFQTLTVFASARPHIFTSDQMTTLRPYIENLSTGDDLVIYNSVLVIYRHVLPILPPLQHDFLEEVQSTLLKTFTKLPKAELNEVAVCLSIIDSVLKNTERLAKLMISVVRALYGARLETFNDFSSASIGSKIRRHVMIAGSFGKACNVESYVDSFRDQLPWWKGDTVSGLLVDVTSFYTEAKHPLTLQEVALQSVCDVCQSWPKNYAKKSVATKIESALQSNNKHLETVVLRAFQAFYIQEEERSILKAEATDEVVAASGAERLGKSMLSSDNDGAAASLAQQYLPIVLKLALSTVDERALIATEVVTSTNRQGLVHPRECGPALVALETSRDMKVAKAAFEEHRNLNSKHESILEKEYLKAIEQAFVYQRDTVKDSSGVEESLEPKLRFFFEVLNTGNASARKKILGNICKRLDFNPAKTSDTNLGESLSYSKFVCQNLALADYTRVDEILHVVSVLSSIFATTGDIISQQIEALLATNPAPQETEHALTQETAQQDVSKAQRIANQAELRRLTTGSIILTLLWQTRSHLRSVWGLQSLLSRGSTGGKTGKVQIKDANRAPARAPNASAAAESYIKTTEAIGALASEAQMLEQCRSFVDLHSTDTEAAKAGVDEDEDENGDGVNGRTETPPWVEARVDEAGTGVVNGSGGSSKVGAGGARRRRRTSTPLGTPSKPRQRAGQPSLGKRRQSGSKSWENDDEGWD